MTPPEPTNAVEPRTIALAAAVAAAVLAAAALAPERVASPLQVPSTSWIVGVAFGLAIGLRHAFEPDHLVAVATMVARRPVGTNAARLGASWGVGHAAALLALGSSLALARRGLPGPLAVLFEVAVAIVITGLGVCALRTAWRDGRSGRERSHTHVRLRHAHATECGHLHIGPVTLARGPLAVGLVHGVAGSGALTALALSSLPTSVERIGFILVFGIGSTLGMAAVAGIAGWPLARLARSRQTSAALSAATGMAAIVFGVTWGAPLVRTLLAY